MCEVQWLVAGTFGTHGVEPLPVLLPWADIRREELCPIPWTDRAVLVAGVEGKDRGVRSRRRREAFKGETPEDIHGMARVGGDHGGVSGAVEWETGASTSNPTTCSAVSTELTA